MTKEQEEQETFRVTDKRSFQEDGEVRNTPDASEKEDQAPAPEPSPEVKSEPSNEGAKKKEPPRQPIDFPSYLLSYYTQGLVLLGEVPSPYTGKKEEDVEASRHTIDILTMLKEKTKGNLNQDEEKLLETVLYELRMKYMSKTSRIKT
jgi:hypothetical protein